MFVQPKSHPDRKWKNKEIGFDFKSSDTFPGGTDFSSRDKHKIGSYIFSMHMILPGDCHNAPYT